MKIEKRHEESDHITHSSIWWIPGWIYLISKLSGTVEYESLWISYLIISFLLWGFYFFKLKK
jgi:hypothetical protein